MKKTLVIGSTVLDMVIQIDHLPTTSEDIHIEKQKMVLGGCAYNAANILDKFKVSYKLLSPIGTGRNAMIVESLLNESDMKVGVKIPEEDNGFCLCMVEKGGERTFVVHHGVEYTFKKEWVPKDTIGEYDSVYIAGLEIEEINGNDIIEFIEENKELRVYFAPGPRLSEIAINQYERIFARNPIIHLNEEEVLTLSKLIIDKGLLKGAASETNDTRLSNQECTDYKAAAEVLQRVTNNTVIITLGGIGAYYLEQGQGVLVPGVKAKVVDTIGAGDSHIGAIMATQKLGYSMQQSVQCANYISAEVVSVSGSSLTKDQFEHAFKNYAIVQN